MQLNASSLNSAVLNGPGRQAVFAFCALVASATVSADALVTKYPVAELTGSASIAATGWQRLEVSCALSGTCAFLAAPPRQTFSSASFLLSTSEASVSADVTRFVTATMQCGAGATASALQRFSVVSVLPCQADVSSQAVRTVYQSATVSCGASVSTAPTRRTIGVGLLAGTAALTAGGNHVVKASASSGGTASIIASCGFAKPSASLVVSGAQVYAYARVARTGRAYPSGASSMTAKAEMLAYGAASASCYALLSARPISTYGAASCSAGADLAASATYQHPSASVVGGTASFMADATRVVRPVGALSGTASARPEPTLNNQLDGYAMPDGSAHVQISANGVVVSPAISYAEAGCAFSATATYQHQVTVALGNGGDLAGTAFVILPGEAHITCGASTAAIGRWSWFGMAGVVVSADVEDVPHVRYLTATKPAIAEANLSATGTAIRRASGAATCSADTSADGALVLFAKATIDAGSGIGLEAYRLGNAVVRDPEERTMRRPSQDRIMRRPFIDRTMKAVRV